LGANLTEIDETKGREPVINVDLNGAKEGKIADLSDFADSADQTPSEFAYTDRA